MTDKTSRQVSSARTRGEQNAASKRMSLSCSPASFAAFFPCSVKAESCRPHKSPRRLYSDSPCRIRYSIIPSFGGKPPCFFFCLIFPSRTERERVPFLSMQAFAREKRSVAQENKFCRFSAMQAFARKKSAGMRLRTALSFHKTCGPRRKFVAESLVLRRPYVTRSAAAKRFRGG